jgi:formylglycine-generating enzyme required for sulfatase activity
MSQEEHRLALPQGYCIETYRIESVLGKGGFGITYKATDTQLGKTVAIKELLPDSIATRGEGYTVVAQSTSRRDDWEWEKERFLEEARMLARYEHPAIVGVHRLIETHGTVYMVMDFVAGESYGKRLRRIGRERDQAAVMAVVGPIMEGLELLHRDGVYHRDIKPDNIMIGEDGWPVLIDFGCARESAGQTMTMTRLMTPGYSPIEQYQTKARLGPWTDIYAMGASMCRAITGSKPPVAVDRVVQDEFEWLGYQNLQGYNEDFLLSVDWALRVTGSERPQSIREWVGAWSREAERAPREERRENPPVAAEPEPIPEVPAPSSDAAGAKGSWSRGNIAVVGVVVALVTLMLVLVGRVVAKGREAEAEAVRKQQASEAVALAQEQAKAEAAEAAEAAAKAAELERLRMEAEKVKAAESARIAAEAAAKAEKDRLAAETARKEMEKPYQNGLGMRFVPVSGTGVLFSVWETRVKDYQAFCDATGRGWAEPDFRQWKKPPAFRQGERHPAVNVSWEDAQAFCVWLTEKERREGKIGNGQKYRLPTDVEWSVAVGLGAERGSMPIERDGEIKGVYPWGTQWPMPHDVGNYDSMLNKDSFEYTSPVGSFGANRHGLYDMGGNVWEWCEDYWYDAERKYRVLRGGSWHGYSGPRDVASSSRDRDHPDYRDDNYGFRCVLVGRGSSP